MKLTQPSSNFKGYELQEWWKDTQKLIGQRGQFDYQMPQEDLSFSYSTFFGVSCTHPDTSITDMYVGDGETSIFLINPGTIYLPPAATVPAKEFYFICYRNTTDFDATWTGNELVVSPSSGEYIQYETSDLVLLDKDNYSTNLKHIISDGINNWIIIP